MTSYSFCLYQIEQLQQCQNVTDQGEHLQKWSKGFALFLGASNYLAIIEQHCSVSERFMQNSEQRQGEVPHEGQRIWSAFRNGILREKMVLKYWNWFGKCIRCSLQLFSWKMQVPINYTDDAVVKRSSCSHLYLQCFHWVPLITICLGSQHGIRSLSLPPSPSAHRAPEHQFPSSVHSHHWLPSALQSPLPASFTAAFPCVFAVSFCPFTCSEKVP